MNELIVWKPSTELQALITGAQSQLDLARSTVVATLEECHIAKQDMDYAHGQLKKLEALKVAATQFIKEVLKERTDYFSPAVKALEGAKAEYARKIGGYHSRQEAVARAAQAEAAKAAAELDMPPPVIVAATADVGQFRDNWGYKVTNWTAVLQYVAANSGMSFHGIAVSDLLAPNEPMFKAVAKATKKEGELFPGLEIVNNRIPVSK